MNRHREKLRTARRHMSQSEYRRHVSPFNSHWWNKQNAMKERKVARRIAKAKFRKENYETKD